MTTLQNQPLIIAGGAGGTAGGDRSRTDATAEGAEWGERLCWWQRRRRWTRRLPGGGGLTGEGSLRLTVARGGGASFINGGGRNATLVVVVPQVSVASEEAPAITTTMVPAVVVATAVAVVVRPVVVTAVAAAVAPPSMAAITRPRPPEITGTPAMADSALHSCPDGVSLGIDRLKRKGAHHATFQLTLVCLLTEPAMAQDTPVPD